MCWTYCRLPAAQMKKPVVTLSSPSHDSSLLCFFLHTAHFFLSAFFFCDPFLSPLTTCFVIFLFCLFILTRFVSLSGLLFVLYCPHFLLSSAFMQFSIKIEKAVWYFLCWVHSLKKSEKLKKFLKRNKDVFTLSLSLSLYSVESCLISLLRLTTRSPKEARLST